jgi:hypothetical protein
MAAHLADLKDGRLVVRSGWPSADLRVGWADLKAVRWGRSKATKLVATKAVKVGL